MDAIDCFRYRLSGNNIAGAPESIKDKSQLEYVIGSSKQYISEGITYSKENSPVPIAENISIYNH